MLPVLLHKRWVAVLPAQPQLSACAAACMAACCYRMWSCAPGAEHALSPSLFQPADEGLSAQLAEWGYSLLCASYTSELASSCPAYFLCIR